MTADDILKRYAEALFVTVEDGVLHGQAIALALRLAVQEAYAAGGALADDLAAIVASQVQPEPDRRAAESAINQIGRLNEWLEVNAPALYHNPDLDTAAAVLAELGVRDRRMIEQSAAIADLRISLKDANEDAASARQELTTLIAERDGLRQQITQMDADEAGLRRQVVELQREVDRLTRQNVIVTDTFNSLAAEHTNGAAAVGHISNVTEPPVDWWQHLDPETNDYRISLDAGRRKFREVPKPARLLLAQPAEPVVDGDRPLPAWAAPEPATVADVVAVHGEVAPRNSQLARHPQHDDLFEFSELFKLAIKGTHRWAHITGEHTAILEAERGLRHLVERTAAILDGFTGQP
jgi:hypothetical protein